MGYIRDPREERTCYQESSPLLPETDFGNDFVCVYGIDPGMPERVKKFKERGYVVHLMTGIAWGNYQDYMDGTFDGREHYDEMQRSRDGSITGEFCHSSGYMVPTVSYTDYLIEKMKVAVDAGVEAIHVEEPEFLNDGGYSDAFKREYLLFYHEPWTVPHESVDAHYRVARLKAYLYRRAIERVSQSLREYALVKYGRVLRFYVPTHSLLNYSQWKVMSPEGTLTDVPSLDGYKAQIWMGTSREANVYKGVYKERTFETAFLEYGVMQELVRGTGRTMWFDNDPIEDRPSYTWENYRYNYVQTLLGSLLQPKINRFQIAPWPRRIFTGAATYPQGEPDAVPIPEDYRTQLANVFQFLGTLPDDDYEYADEMPEVGVFLSDTAMFQRNFSDDVMAKKADFAPVGRIEIKSAANYIPGMEQTLTSGSRLDYYESIAFPLFYGLTLPLLKNGVPVRPVQLENVIRYPGYLDMYKVLVLSYEFMKPQGADVNVALAAYVTGGGTLVYVGDGLDPFHKIRGWWNTGKNSDPTPLEHLLRLLGVAEDAPDGEYACGDGRFVLLRQSPADISVETEKSDAYVKTVAALAGVKKPCNHISLRRGDYRITAVMDESVSDEPVVHRGSFVDLLAYDLPVCTEKVVTPGNYAVLLDLDRLAALPYAILGTSIRIERFDVSGEGFVLEGRGANLNAYIRVKLPNAPRGVSLCLTPADDVTETPDETIRWQYDEASKSLLLSFRNLAGHTRIAGKF
ncbi:MAG: hypothetical protein IJK02_06510 [Clostridia bacterium]|nr:hypothetical protein [Clostridia bacterium]